LAGPIGLFVKFSTLQDYGVDKVFFLENGNADVSQRNVVFLARGDSAKQVQSIAGQWALIFTLIRYRPDDTCPSSIIDQPLIF
jgi:hypothetical protein